MLGQSVLGCVRYVLSTNYAEKQSPMSLLNSQIVPEETALGSVLNLCCSSGGAVAQFEHVGDNVLAQTSFGQPDFLES
jgi:hypothetical protein